MTANPRRPGAEPQTRAAEARRDAQGRMLPGTTPNPGGRPRVWREFQEAMRDRTPRAIEVIDEAPPWYPQPSSCSKTRTPGELRARDPDRHARRGPGRAPARAGGRP